MFLEIIIIKKVRKGVTFSGGKFSVTKRSAAAIEKVCNEIQFCEHCVYTTTNLLYFMYTF